MRFIDADLEVSDYVTVWDCDCSEFGKQTVMAVGDLQYLPTADVVPKSEVADLQDALKCEKQTNKHLSDEYIALMKENEKLTINMNAYALTAKRLKEDVDRLQEINNNQVESIRLAKQEVAREIFREIKYNFEDLRKVEYANPQLQVVFNLLDYLEKK